MQQQQVEEVILGAIVGSFSFRVVCFRHVPFPSALNRAVLINTSRWPRTEPQLHRSMRRTIPLVGMISLALRGLMTQVCLCVCGEESGVRHQPSTCLARAHAGDAEDPAPDQCGPYALRDLLAGATVFYVELPLLQPPQNVKLTPACGSSFSEQPDFEAFTFNGRSKIRLIVNEATSTIVLHCNEVRPLLSRLWG